jgi:5-methylcytosine-specific restriction endonuclease McrBC GTP-binding regulatory subunit McrB
MNRANLSRVFGELMYLFEYRDEPIALQYSTEFALPKQLLFVGTMNTADRSIRSIDIALRRRFDVFECEPDAGILERYFLTHENNLPSLVPGFSRLNEKLTEHLDRHHTIGHTFFMHDPFSYELLRRIWTHKLGPLIEEYFFDQPDLASQFTCEEFWPEQ